MPDAALAAPKVFSDEGTPAHRIALHDLRQKYDAAEAAAAAAQGSTAAAARKASKNSIVRQSPHLAHGGQRTNRQLLLVKFCARVPQRLPQAAGVLGHHLSAAVDAAGSHT